MNPIYVFAGIGIIALGVLTLALCKSARVGDEMADKAFRDECKKNAQSKFTKQIKSEGCVHE